MKKVVLSALMGLLAVSGAFAQANTVLVYGTGSFTSRKVTKESTYDFSPAVGYQFNDNWTGGLTLSVVGSKYGEGTSEVKSSELGVGPFIRYAYPLSDIFAVYGQLNATALSGKTTTAPGLESKYSGFQGTLFPAIGVNLRNGFALNFGFGGLTFHSTKTKGTSVTNQSVKFNFGSGLNFGISKNFGL